jgi:precorrin-2 dehydrogenase/sirohydrochlorin ferrochelatase
MARLYPMYVILEGRKAVVIGGGKVAERKVEVLLDCGAEVEVISPELTESLAGWEREGRLRVQRREFRAGDTSGAWLVIAACGDEAVNREVFEEAERGGIFCNVVDEPELCSFQAPAVVQRGAMQIAISTGGASPALAKRLRKELEEKFGPWHETFLAGLSELRDHIKAKYPADQSKRAEIFEGFVNSEALEWLREGEVEAYRKILEEWKDK